MSEVVAQEVVAPVAAPVKKVKKTPSANPKPKATHPKFPEMIAEALKKLNEKSGSSRHAIVKYIMATYNIEEKITNKHTKVALRAGVQNNNLKQSKGTGVTGSFKLGDAAKLKEKLAEKEAKKKARSTQTKESCC